MTTRFCVRCEAEVQYADGYCLLGHPLRIEPSTGSLSSLRDEVDRAMEQARVELDNAFAAVPVGAVDPSVPPPPPATPTHDRYPFMNLSTEPLPVENDPMDGFAPSARMDWGPDRRGLLERLRLTSR